MKMWRGHCALRFRKVSRTVSVLAAGLLLGCGSNSTPSRTVTGVVTDFDGQAVAGASIDVGGKGTTSLANGTFTVSGVPDGLRNVRATVTINGNTWSGETTADIVGDEQNRSINVVVSDNRFQGSIAGSVIDPSGFGLVGAKVFIGGKIGSKMVVTDSNGNYRADRIPSGATYTATCSLAGYVNDTKTNIQVTQNNITPVSFALSSGTSQGSIPAPANVTAQAVTIPDSITRAPDTTRNLYEALKRQYRRQRGLPDKPHVAQTVTYRTPQTTRSTPLGAVIEVDLFWDYQSYNDLFGYAIKRIQGSPTDQTLLPPTQVVAILRDPLTAAFFDVDTALTPDTPYYYTVHRLDTIDFPRLGDSAIGPASQAARANPLSALTGASPANGVFVSTTPTLRWNGVSGATRYDIYVYDRFPDLQNVNDTNNGAIPIWRGNTTGTSAQYGGPTLQHGATYYWLVVASDSGTNALSFSPISKFNVQ